MRGSADPIARVLRVVDVYVQRGDLYLVEVEQVLPDGQRRSRWLPVSEKIMREEPVIDGAVRALREELALSTAAVNILAAAQQPQVVIKESPSYPGLPTRYLIHRVEVSVESLPGEDFWTDEPSHHPAEGPKRHHWRWVTRS